MERTALILTFVHAFITIRALDANATFQTCCDMGLALAMEHNSCVTTGPANGIPLDEQSLCLSVIELCCARKIREMDCEDGKDAAKTGGNCPQQKSIDEQHCCESCKLGLITGSMGAACQLGEITFGRLWDSAFYSCCTQSNDRSADGEKQEQENVCDILQGELCAHICIPEQGSYRCECQPGYRLMADNKGCEYITRCSKTACSQLCEDDKEGFKCSCYDGYQLESDNFTCSRIKPIDSNCGPGFRLNPLAKVCQDINECTEDTPCDANQECRNSPGGYDCVCKVGLALDRFTLTCADVDECAGTNPCATNEQCVNTFGSYKCQSQDSVSTSQTRKPSFSDFVSKKKACPTGYQVSNNEGDCVDYDECIETPCDSTQNCVNAVGSYSCECKTGFERDNFTGGCVDINECQLNRNACTEGERCDNAPGSYGCVRMTSCGTGYTLNQATNRCEDDDECTLGTDTCRFIGPGWGCKNVQGSFRCIRNRTRTTKLSCPPGYNLDDSKSKCMDINECLTGQHSCKSNEICTNIAGNYTCGPTLECKPGFRMREDGRRCNDVNECVENQGICSHRCINTWGSFMCGCEPGYKLQTDKRTCVDDNECSRETSHRRLCMGVCVNKPGSYYCECPEGYRLHSDKFSCIDIDECANYPCAENEVCTNIQGAYRCTDTTCQPGYVKDPYKSTKCVRDCFVNDEECRNKPFSYTAHFINLVANATLPRNGLRFFTMGSTGSNSRADFDIDPPESDAPPSIEKAARDHFRLETSGSNSATLILQKPLEGPQDVHLTIRMSYFNDEIYLGYTIVNIDLFVSQFTY